MNSFQVCMEIYIKYNQQNLGYQNVLKRLKLPFQNDELLLLLLLYEFNFHMELLHSIALKL